MKIAYFTESLYPHIDGVSTTLARLFETLERRGVEFLVFSPFVPGASVSWSRRVVAVPYVRFPLYAAYRVSLPASPGLSRMLDRFAPDVVHLVSPTPMALWARRYARSRGWVVVASFHTHFVSYFGYYRLRFLEPLGWPLLRSFYRGCTIVFAPSAATAGELRARGIDNVGFWSRGIDCDRFSPAFRDASLRAAFGPADRPLLLFVGRLVKEKNVDILIDVDRFLRARGHAFTLTLIGDGPRRNTLRAALPEAYFAGTQTGVELSRWFASADLLLFPSTTETFGNVVQEAAASGVASIVAGRGGPLDLVQHGRTGLIARPNDARDFAYQTERLLADAALRRRMGEAARKAIETRDWDSVNAAMLETCERLVRSSQDGRGRAT